MGEPGMASAVDSSLQAYTQAWEALHRKNWSKAAELFATVVESSDLPEVRERARQYLAACRQQEAQQAAAKSGKKPRDEEDEADPYLRAVVEKNRGDLAAALALCRQGGNDQKDERFAYLAASIHALEGRADEAAQVLSRAVELSSKNRIHAFHDPDFAELRGNPSFRQLFGLS
jgi:tetratricopeptide (TPR) repeat protein